MQFDSTGNELLPLQANMKELQARFESVAFFRVEGVFLSALIKCVHPRLTLDTSILVGPGCNVTRGSKKQGQTSRAD